MRLRRTHLDDPLPDENMGVPLPGTLVDWSALPEDRLLNEEVQTILRASIDELPPILRAAFILRDVEQLTTAECAQIQRISEAACKVRLHRARLRLRERLSGSFLDQFDQQEPRFAPPEESL